MFRSRRSRVHVCGVSHLSPTSFGSQPHLVARKYSPRRPLTNRPIRSSLSP